MKQPAACFLASAATMLLLAGCHSTINSVEPAQPVAQRDMLADKRIVTDSGLNRKVRVVGIDKATSEAGFLKVQVEIQNTTSRMQSFTWLAEWFDENGMIINLPSRTSEPKTLVGKESSQFTITAPTPRAKDFRVKFLESSH